MGIKKGVFDELINKNPQDKTTAVAVVVAAESNTKITSKA